MVKLKSLKRLFVVSLCLFLLLSLLPFGSYADPSESEYYIYSDNSSSIIVDDVTFYGLSFVFPSYSNTDDFLSDVSSDPFFINGYQLTSVYLDDTFSYNGSFVTNFFGSFYTLVIVGDPSVSTNTSWIRISYLSNYVYAVSDSPVYVDCFESFLGLDSSVQLIISEFDSFYCFYCSDPDLHVPIYRQSDLSPSVPDSPTVSVFNVFTVVGEWIVQSLSDLAPVFYDSNGLTFLGLVCVIPLGMSVCFLLISIILSFLRFRS